MFSGATTRVFHRPGHNLRPKEMGPLRVRVWWWGRDGVKGVDGDVSKGVGVVGRRRRSARKTWGSLYRQEVDRSVYQTVPGVRPPSSRPRDPGDFPVPVTRTLLPDDRLFPLPTERLLSRRPHGSRPPCVPSPVRFLGLGSPRPVVPRCLPRTRPLPEARPTALGRPSDLHPRSPSETCGGGVDGVLRGGTGLQVDHRTFDGGGGGSKD